jgi:hypothetical protein
MSAIDGLLDKLRSVSSERERAALEAQIWGQTPKAERPKGGIGHYFHDHYKSSVYSVANRHILYNAGPAIDPIWERIDKNMPLNTAVTIFRRAKLYVQNTGVSLSEAISRKLREYDSIGHVTVVQGKVIRRRNPTRVSSHDGDFKKSDEYKVFWNNLRKSFYDFLNHRLSGCDPLEVERIQKIFEVDLDMTVSNLQNLVSRAKGQKLIPKISRGKLIEACYTLGMDPPRVGKNVDIKKISKQWRIHARQYHPDVNPNASAQFEAAKIAYELLKEYHENFARPIVSLNNNGENNASSL